MFTSEERRELDDAIAVLKSMSAPDGESQLMPRARPSMLAPEPRFDHVPGAAGGATAYQTLVEQIPAVTFLAPLDGSVNQVYVSPQIEQLLGYTQREWIEDPVLWYERLHDEDKQRWTEDAAVTFSQRTPLDGTYRFVARDGSTVWIRGHVKIVHNAAGEPEFMHGVGFDVTESKLAELERSRLGQELERKVEQRTAELSRAQTELQRYAGELERSNEDLEQFAYVASHDLQEPLRTLITFSDLLEANLTSRGQLTEQDQRYLRFIGSASGHMRQLVGDLLSLSRVGRSELIKSPTDLDRLVQEILLRLDDNVQRTGAAVHVDTLGEVLADERLLAQALQNLIANALKFCDKKAPEVCITIAQGADAVVVGVRDNGIGIDPRHFEVIFAPFQRLNKSQYEGTGIGLAICRKVADLHGGRLWVESEPGQGAHFQLSIPRK